MKTSGHPNAFHIIGPLWGESTGHQMVFIHKRPLMQSFDVFFDVGMEKLLNKQSSCQWSKTPMMLMWHHCYVILEWNKMLSCNWDENAFWQFVIQSLNWNMKVFFIYNISFFVIQHLNWVLWISMFSFSYHIQYCVILDHELLWVDSAACSAGSPQATLGWLVQWQIYLTCG